MARSSGSSGPSRRSSPAREPGGRPFGPNCRPLARRSGVELWFRALVAGAALLGGTLAASPAFAALTTSEQAQINGFVSGGRVENAAKVRSLVARPDLSIDESAASLASALAPVPFNDARAAFLRDMLFGGASASARPVLAVATTRALVARADALLSRSGADLDAPPDVLGELARLYTFLGGDIANAGNPAPMSRGGAHNPAVGIPPSAYDDCARTLADHVQKNPRWLKPDAPVPSAAAHVRAALELALYEMTNDTPTRRVDAADRLGLAGARRAFLTELGILVLDSGKADDGRVQRARALVERLPALRADVEAIVFGEGRGGGSGLRPRGQVLGIVVPLEAAAPPASAGAESGEVEPGPLDLPLFVLAYELSNVAVPRALDDRPGLRALAAEDTAGSAAGSSTGAMTLEQRLATTMAQLITDAPRTLDLAFARWLGGRPETASLVSDAMGLLAAFAPTARPTSGLVIPLARARPPDGEPEPLPATNVRLAPTGAVTAFALAGHLWKLHRNGRDEGGAVDAVRRDGALVTLAALPTARIPMSDGPSWSGEGLVFARFLGAPRAGIGPGPRIHVVSGGERGTEAIATAAPGDDLVLEADLTLSGEAGVVVRAVSTKSAFQGASLVLIPGTPPRASLRASEGAGTESEMAPPVELAPAAAYHVRILVQGAKIEATVNGLKLSGALPASLAHGDLALRVKRGATLDAAAWTVRKR